MKGKITQVHHFTSDELVDLISRSEIAKELSVSLVTIDQWCKKGILKRYRIGNLVRFKRSEIEEAITKIDK